jgi:hypothetical protein
MPRRPHPNLNPELYNYMKNPKMDAAIARLGKMRKELLTAAACVATVTEDLRRLGATTRYSDLENAWVALSDELMEVRCEDFSEPMLVNLYENLEAVVREAANAHGKLVIDD